MQTLKKKTKSLNIWLIYSIYLLTLWLILSLMSFIKSASAQTKYKKPHETIEEIAKKRGVDPEWMKAICWAESAHKYWAFNRNDGGEGVHSFGMCQILHTTAKIWGVKDKRCYGDFLITKYPNSKNVYKNCKLFGVKYNIRIATLVFGRVVKKYNGDMEKAVAAYNAGKYRLCPKHGWLIIKGKRFKRCKQGGPVNSYYVDKVKCFKDKKPCINPKVRCDKPIKR